MSDDTAPTLVEREMPGILERVKMNRANVALYRQAREQGYRGLSSNTAAEVCAIDREVLADALAQAAASEAALVEALEECLREHGGFTIAGECERRAHATLASRSARATLIGAVIEAARIALAHVSGTGPYLAEALAALDCQAESSPPIEQAGKERR
jgi:hypothetical protein